MTKDKSLHPSSFIPHPSDRPSEPAARALTVLLEDDDHAAALEILRDLEFEALQHIALAAQALERACESLYWAEFARVGGRRRSHE